MATTDARAGFRLPWSSERSTTDQTETAQADAAADAAATVAPADGETAADWGAPASSGPEEHAVADGAPTEAADETWPASSPAPARRPRKFLADLTRAMRTAAEEARAQALAQIQSDAKAHVEQIHSRSATEAADLRRQADEDIAAVRDWSKAEIARIREATETRISSRKARLDGEVETHAALIEREVELVQLRVAAFEQEMTDFFERLLAEEDPSRFATMAENLPEPPPFESIVVTAEDLETLSRATAVEPAGATDGEAVEASVEVVDATPGEAAATEVSDEEAVGTLEPAAEVDRESAFAAIQAAAEAAVETEAETEAEAEAETEADEIVADGTDVDVAGMAEVATDEADAPGADDAEVATDDPRLAALELSADIAEAEAEAAASADVSSDGEEIAEIPDDALAARLNGLVPGNGDENAAASATTATQVVVTGLVSVASIASFKRHLGRTPGVQSVGVSSGPEGEFVFAVSHSADVVVRDVIPSLPTFQARVTGATDGTVTVAAHDPESDN